MVGEIIIAIIAYALFGIVISINLAVKYSRIDNIFFIYLFWPITIIAVIFASIFKVINNDNESEN